MAERNCDKCVYGRRSGNCTAWNCKGTVTVEDIKAEARQSAIDEVFRNISTLIPFFSNEQLTAYFNICDKIEQLKKGENNG